MRDKEIIYKFLKSFSVRVDDNEHMFVIFDDFTRKKIFYDDFIKYFLKIFDVYKTDDERLSFEICQEWLDNEKSKLTIEIDNYLNTCQVRFGKYNWEVIDSEGNHISEEKISEVFLNNGSKKFILSCYDRWYTNKILEISNEIMNKF